MAKAPSTQTTTINYYHQEFIQQILYQIPTMSLGPL